MSIFCLVHGVCLGAWCWEPLICELEAREHHAITMNSGLTQLSHYARQHGCAEGHTIKLMYYLNESVFH